MSLLLIVKTFLITKEHLWCLQYICAMQWSHIQDPNLKAVSTPPQTLVSRLFLSSSYLEKSYS